MMIGSTGERMLGIALPYVDAWNTWYEQTGNTPEGFERESAKVTDAARRTGRDPGEIARSACVLVVLDPTDGERPIAQGVDPVDGAPDRVAAHLRALAEAGAADAILVASPITESSIRELGAALDLLDG